jgi:hypothetical protein
MGISLRGLFDHLTLKKREPKCAKVVNFIRRSTIFAPILRLIFA